VGIRDNFFDLGGHSILALRLVSKIESETGINLPLIDLFQGKTIEDIASSKNDKTDLPDYLVGIRKTGSLNPFFAVGSHPRYSDAANQVDKDRPFYKLDVYALQSRRLAQGKSPYKNIAALVDEFIDSIQKIQPSGPYYLGGGCEGALLAFALATELQRRGEEVKTLILWITPAPGYGNGAVFGRSAIYRVINHLRALLGHAQIADLNLRTLSELLKHEYLEYRIFRAMDTYQTNAIFSGEIVLARCVENRKAWDTDLALGWGERATSGARVHKLSGNHDTWLVDHTEAFGDFLNSCL
jgi:surfactin synthase thioesterase subunit